MGRARIVEHRGYGLYRATPVWNFGRLNLELMNLQVQQDQYWSVMNNSLTAKYRLADDVAIARQALDAVIAQWKQALIDKIKTTQPTKPSTPDDPETGQPWVDPDRAQDKPLLDGINAARAAAGVGAVTINTNLSRASVAYAKYQGYTGRTGHTDSAGRGPESRASGVGYNYTEVGELLAYGAATAEEAIASFLKSDAGKATLLDGGFTEIGVAYCHVPDHFGGHIWVITLGKPGPPSSIGGAGKKKDDPATEKATETEAKLEKITLPKLDNLSPDQLGKAAQNFGIAIAKLREAEREIAWLQTENLVREKRITELGAIKAAAMTEMDVWCVRRTDLLAPGMEVNSVEIPGFWEEQGVLKKALVGIRLDEILIWVERSWNLLSSADDSTGKLTPAEGMTDAAVFVNAALEPGHLRWRPLWRYATITQITDDLCSLVLQATIGRSGSDPVEYPLDEPKNLVLSNVPIHYPPCNGIGTGSIQLFSNLLIFKSDAKNR